MSTLGVDLGAKRIGVSVSMGDMGVVTPLCVIEIGRSPTLKSRRGHRQKKAWAIETRTAANTSEAIAVLGELCDEWEVQTMVIGRPVSLDGVGRDASGRADDLIGTIRDTLAVDVQTYDERFTTSIAADKLTQVGHDAADQRHMIDAYAAVEILRDWLARRANETISPQQPKSRLERPTT